MYDVIIAGGGIAGLSAALLLGRCRRKVLICDSGRPRNMASHALHGFISRNGINPHELRSITRGELKDYPSLMVVPGEIVDAEEQKQGYRVIRENGASYQCRYLLIATGVVDRLPPIGNIEKFYGSNVFHCPYCDGWEVRDQPLAVYGQGTTGYEYALELTIWSRDVVLLTDGGDCPQPEQNDHLQRHGVAVVNLPLERVEGEAGGTILICFRDGSRLARRALFFNPDQYQASPLAEKLGCTVTDGGVIKTGKFQQTNPRLFVAGDAARSIQLAVIAAAEGAEAAYAINTLLHKEVIG